MATPNPSQTLSKAPQNAATPTSHPQLAAFSSPAPRSVASPAHLRNQNAGKSPYNAPTNRDLTGLNAASVAASAASFKMPTSSPAAGMLNTESPAAMIYSLSALEHVIPMGLGMSGLGGTGTSMRSSADNDEERRKRLVEVVTKLRSRPPRISIEGLEILAKRMSLDCQVDEDRRTGKKTVTLAGTTFLVDVHLDVNAQVESVKVPYLGSDEAVVEKNAAVETLLLDILSPDKRRSNRDLAFSPSQINGDLAKFEENLEYLGRLDKLSKQPGDASFDCFAAITGVYNGLKRLYEYEKTMALALMNAERSHREVRAEREVMCKKSGRPRLHERGRIGLRLDYWMQQRHIFTGTENGPDGGDVEMSGQEQKSAQGLEANVYSLLIECEDLNAGTVGQPARITDAWLGNPIEQPALTTTDLGPTDPSSHINWIDPPPTYTKPSSEPTQTDSFGLEAASIAKLPAVRFVAKLDPPLVVQYYFQPNSSGNDIQNQYLAPTRTFAGLLLKPDATEDFGSELTDSSKEFARSSHVTYGPPDAPDGVSHENFLWVSKPDVGKLITEIPFSHPQELVQLLPKLRQYASLNQLLKQTFDGVHQTLSSSKLKNTSRLSRNVHVDLCSMLEPKPRLAVSFSNPPNGRTPTRSKEPSEKNDPSQVSLDDFLAENDDDDDDDRSLSSETSSTVTFEILPNADLQVVESDLIDGLKRKDSADRGERMKKMSRALDVCGGLGIWVEWMARHRDRL